MLKRADRMRIKRSNLKYSSKALFKVFAHSMKSLKNTFPIIVGGLIFICLVILIFGIMFSLNADQLSGFEVKEKLGFLEKLWVGLYFSAITYFTIGFGDISPLENGMRIVSVFEAIIAFVTNMILSGLILNQLIKPVNYLHYGNKLIINDAQDAYKVTIRLHLINRGMWLYNLSSKLIMLKIDENTTSGNTEEIMKVTCARDIYRGIIELEFKVEGADYGIFKSFVDAFDMPDKALAMKSFLRIHTTALDAKGAIHHKSIQFEPMHYTNSISVKEKSVLRNMQYKNCVHYENKNDRLIFIGVTDEDVNAVDAPKNHHIC